MRIWRRTFLLRSLAMRGPRGDDFLLQEDGVPQTMRGFSRESDLPLTIGLLVDTSNSQLHVCPGAARQAPCSDQVLREGLDQAFVARFRRSG